MRSQLYSLLLQSDVQIQAVLWRQLLLVWLFSLLCR